MKWQRNLPWPIALNPFSLVVLCGQCFEEVQLLSSHTQERPAVVTPGFFAQSGTE